MELNEATSQGKLEQLLEDGKVNAEEYEQLSSAMGGGVSEPDGGAAQPRERKRLSRDVHRAKIAGVCAGLARHFGVDPMPIRALAAGSIFLLGPLSMVLYVVLTFTLPWDDPDAANSAPRLMYPFSFPISVAIVVFFVPWFYSTFIIPQLWKVYDDFGASTEGLLPSVTIVASNLQRSISLPVLPVIVTYGILFLSVVPCFMQSDRPQSVYKRTVLWAGIFWFLILVVGSLIPMAAVVNHVK